MQLFLRQWRKHLGLSLVEVAGRLNTAHTTLGRWEKGEVELNEDHIRRIAQALGVTVAELQFPPERRDEGLRLHRTLELLKRLKGEDIDAWLEIGERMPSARK